MYFRTMALWLCGVLAGGPGCERRCDCAPAAHAETPRPAVRPAQAAAKPVEVSIAMQHVHLHVDEGIVLEIARLHGTMVSRDAGQPPVFDDQRSYVLRVDTAEIAMGTASLAALMNHHVFGADGSPLSDITATVREGRIALKGKLHKGLTVPFSAKAAVGVTGDGRLRLHLESLKTAGVPAKGLMQIFGLELADVVDLKNRRDVAIDGDDVVIAPGQALPPPEIRGHLTSAAIRAGGLVITFRAPGGGQQPSHTRGRQNYVLFSGGSLRFGKLTMRDADLRLIDADPRDPFDFYPARYERQLVAGYSKNTAAGGLRTVMPDYDDLTR
jgi:hypothetical protein